MDDSMLKRIGEILDSGETAALVTIIATRGSTPRKAGTKMLVLPGGAVLGTVGGGCIEADIRRAALQALDTGRSAVYSFSLLDDAAADEGMACGGVMDVFVQII